jgi:hypothetical protein
VRQEPSQICGPARVHHTSHAVLLWKWTVMQVYGALLASNYVCWGRFLKCDWKSRNVAGNRCFGTVTVRSFCVHCISTQVQVPSHRTGNADSK